MWLAGTNGNSKQKKGEASCTCSDPRGSSTMAKQGTADASQKPIDPSSLSTTEALAGTLVATVFEFVQLKTVTPEVLNDARAHPMRRGRVDASLLPSQPDRVVPFFD